MKDHLTKSIKILGLVVLIVLSLVYAKPFLVPLTFAGLFAMLLLPVSRRFQRWGLGSGLSNFLALFLFILLIAGILGLLAWQFSDIAKNSSDIEKNVDIKIREAKDYLSEKFGVSRKQQNEIIEEQKQSGGNLSSQITTIASSFGSFLTNLLLTMVYVFLFLYLRKHFHKFILMLVPASKKKDAEAIIHEGKGVASNYITGMAWMILCLFIMYSIGFGIVGVKSFFLFAALCALLEIVPFVGNLTGNLLTVVAVIMQGGSSGMIIGVLCTYAIVQFLQSYILEPLVVGRGVSLNPFFTIAGIVAGEMVWGIPGMILAIPVLGIIKIICDHIPSLQPVGFLIGQEKEAGPGLKEKIKGWFK